MKKVINITIGQVVFTIEEEAYNQLFSYLESIRKHFAKDKNREEILEDIEISIAEKFLKKQKNKTATISVANVEQVISQMGTIKDFKNEEEGKGETEKASSSTKKRLYRNPDDMVIGGVASGLAAYFGVSVIWVRLAFLLTLFFGGLGAIVYLILWIVMPLAETPEQQLEMRGETIDIHRIQELIKSRAKEIKSQHGDRVGKAVHNMAAKSQTIFKNIGLALATLVRIPVGLAFTIAGVLGIFLSSLALAWAINGIWLPPLGVMTKDLFAPDMTAYWMIAGLIYFTVVLTSLIGLFIGLSLLKKKVVGGISLLILMTLWFFATGFTISYILPKQELIEERVNFVLKNVPQNNCLEWNFLEGFSVCDDVIRMRPAIQDYEIYIDPNATIEQMIADGKFAPSYGFDDVINSENFPAPPLRTGNVQLKVVTFGRTIRTDYVLKWSRANNLIPADLYALLALRIADVKDLPPQVFAPGSISNLLMMPGFSLNSDHEKPMLFWVPLMDKVFSNSSLIFFPKQQ